MRKSKRIIAFCLALILGGVAPAQSVCAQEGTAVVSEEKTEQEQAVDEIKSEAEAVSDEKTEEVKVERYAATGFVGLKEAVSMLEKQYQTSEQTVETVFLKYFVQRVYSYMEYANQMLAAYQEKVQENPVEMQQAETFKKLCLFALEEKTELIEQLDGFIQFNLLKEECLQKTVKDLKTALQECSSEQLLADAGEEALQEMQYVNLPVALHVQQTTYTCGMASVKMILDYLKLTDKKGVSYEESALWNWADSNGQGTYVYRVAQTLTRFGAHYKYKHMAVEGQNKVEFYWEMIKASLEMNRPVIAQIRPQKNEYWDYSSGHYILVKGMYVDNQGIPQVIINDCHYKYSAQNKVVPLEELIQSNENHSSYMIFGK